ncbi:hypothetical protein PAPYR_8749 [Paratrimastix pyriformis]|uniref:Uncharacterized protein n=1 Tax=Paratrimastix pyriformis TaxID=342808 RepID=A0ABQ8UA04_9EUKA|nr:hypothetical protein PAPYR_8749 [Paratrimastix pyriformis]
MVPTSTPKCGSLLRRMMEGSPKGAPQPPGMDPDPVATLSALEERIAHLEKILSPQSSPETPSPSQSPVMPPERGHSLPADESEHNLPVDCDTEDLFLYSEELPSTQPITTPLFPSTLHHHPDAFPPISDRFDRDSPYHPSMSLKLHDHLEKASHPFIPPPPRSRFAPLPMTYAKGKNCRTTCFSTLGGGHSAVEWGSVANYFSSSLPPRR